MDEEEDPDDPTIRDKMENGAVYCRPRYPRIRDTYKINFGNCTADDRLLVKNFRNAHGGWDTFIFMDARIPDAPVPLTVRFSKLPIIKDDKWSGAQKRFKISFEITEL
jgi:hypothetical protein